VRDVLAIHGRLLAVHGGAEGLRDPALLESALARPRQHHVYSKKAGTVEMAALYTAGIVATTFCGWQQADRICDWCSLPGTSRL